MTDRRGEVPWGTRMAACWGSDLQKHESPTVGVSVSCLTKESSSLLGPGKEWDLGVSGRKSSLQSLLGVG